MECKLVIADLDLIAGPKNHRGGGARVVDESPVSAAAIGYIEQTLLGTLQHGVIARDAFVVQNDVVAFATADSNDPISLHRELADLTIDLDLKISWRNVTHLIQGLNAMVLTGLAGFQLRSCG